MSEQMISKMENTKACFLGIDLGSSSLKLALVDVSTGKKLALVNEPENEMEITAIHPDWAEQDPITWWEYICKGVKRVIKDAQIDASLIEGIGISYQMHGLVVVDKNQEPLRNSIIWCDSRAIEIGNKAFDGLGHDKCSEHLLNSPGNFTASKLKWVLDNEPDVYSKIHKFMLPGDFVAAKLTGTICTTKNSLSEGILWDYKEDKIADWLLDYYGIDTNLIPDIVDNFTNQGEVNEEASKETGIPVGCPVIYRAGDQPNNALSLNIFNQGEVAATGGTSGVIYAVTNQLKSKESSRINHFAHVNYTNETTNIGKLLCINGAGIMYRWLRNNVGTDSYEQMNRKASTVTVGSGGVLVIPFGNGAERMLNSVNTGVHFANMNLNQHTHSHLYRAALEGIAFAFVYGMEILTNDNLEIKVIRAGNDNLFRSEIFANTVATLIGYDIEIYNTTGAIGAARACSLIDGDFEKFGAKISNNDHVMTYKPQKNKEAYLTTYTRWKTELENILKIKL